MMVGKRLVLVLVVMVVASFVAGLIWKELLNTRIPSYLSGVIGGFAAIGAWELFRRRRL